RPCSRANLRSFRTWPSTRRNVSSTRPSASTAPEDPEDGIGIEHPPLTNRSVVRDLLTRHGLAADKSFGQNFLVDPGVLSAVVGAARLDPGHTVLEVGPGLGTLTRELAREAGQVIAVELARRPLAVLAETVARPGHGNAVS